MFERFTERARKVVVLAQEEASHFNHNYIGTEHILLGLVRESEGVASQMLSSMGVEADDVYEQVIRGLTGEPGRRSASARRHVGSAESARNRLLFRGKAASLRSGARIGDRRQRRLVDLDYTYAVLDSEQRMLGAHAASGFTVTRTFRR
jgi:ATP-dependent Clp protease ATP-binding subunit ClpA